VVDRLFLRTGIRLPLRVKGAAELRLPFGQSTGPDRQPGTAPALELDQDADGGVVEAADAGLRQQHPASVAVALHCEHRSRVRQPEVRCQWQERPPSQNSCHTGGMAVRTPFRSVVAYTPVPVATFTLGGQPGFDFAICTERPGPVITETGLTFLVEHDLSRLVEADLVLVSPVDDVEQPPTPAVVEALRAAYQRGAILAGCCTGAFTLAATGLLDGRRATTHWRWADAFRRQYPAVRLEPGILYADEGQLLTSAGAAAVLDLCLYLLRREHGAAVATALARDLVVPPHRDGGQAQYIAVPVPVGYRR
jgi:putative intracellular protease/amidase